VNLTPSINVTSSVLSQRLSDIAPFFLIEKLVCFWQLLCSFLLISINYFMMFPSPCIPQSGVDQLIVEVPDGEGKQPARLKAGMQMLGLDVSKGTILVYDGTKAVLHKVTMAVNNSSTAQGATVLVLDIKICNI
jgi:hypothetical protein